MKGPVSGPVNSVRERRPGKGLAPLANIAAYASIHQTVRFDPIARSGRALASGIVRIAAVLPRIRVRRIVFAARTV